MVTLPSSLTLGETFKFETAEYTAASSLTIKMGGPEARIIEATLTDAKWTASVSTAAWKAGDYATSVWVTLNGETAVVARGRLYLEADPSAQSTYDPTTDYEAIVQKIDAALRGDSSDPTWQSYTISTPQGSRTLARMSIPDLLKLRSYYMSYVIWQNRRDKGLNINGPRIVVRI